MDFSGVLGIHFFVLKESFFLIFVLFFIQNQIIMNFFVNLMSFMRNFENIVEFYVFSIPT